jgi:hypothetical protein
MQGVLLMIGAIFYWAFRKKYRITVQYYFSIGLREEGHSVPSPYMRLKNQ